MRQVRGRYSRVRSITMDLRAIIRDNIDRKNYLQMHAIAALRSMRSVFCGVFYIVGQSG